MRLLLEIDGPVLDVWPTWYASHKAAAADVGWSKLDRATFQRLMRTQGRGADLLGGAKPVKQAEYRSRFEHHVETDGATALLSAHEGSSDALGRIARYASCIGVTLGSNLAGRVAAMERAGLRMCLSRAERLDSDPRRRPAELKLLAEGDPRTLVVACSDALLRAAGSAELVSVGLTCGPAVAARLHQAGAGVVYADLSALAASLQAGAADLIRAGLLPPSFGGV